MESQDKIFLQEFIQSGLDWKVSTQELIDINSRKQFIKTHLKNCNSQLNLSTKAFHFPIEFIFALSTINNSFCTRRLVNFLKHRGRRLMESSNQQAKKRNTLQILFDLFQDYFKGRIHPCINTGEIVIEKILPAYLSMIVVKGTGPDLRIKTLWGLWDEHGRMQAAF